jgi:hypothetical protein
MKTLTYEPIRDESEVPATKADLYSLYEKLESLYKSEKTPEEIIYLED